MCRSAAGEGRTVRQECRAEGFRSLSSHATFWNGDCLRQIMLVPFASQDRERRPKNGLVSLNVDPRMGQNRAFSFLDYLNAKRLDRIRSLFPEGDDLLTSQSGL